MTWVVFHVWPLFVLLPWNDLVCLILTGYVVALPLRRRVKLAVYAVNHWFLPESMLRGT